MIKCPLLKTSFLTLLVYFFFAGNVFAEEKYDADTYGPEATIVWDQPARATFDHKPHTMDAGLECTSCHDDLFSMESGTAVQDKNFTMKAMAEGQYCGSCHDGDTAFATTTNCSACHAVSEEPIVWNEPTKVTFSHTSHTEDLGFECETCHTEIFAMKKGAAAANKNFTMAAFKEGLYCGSCHNGSDAFDSATQCGSCHFPPTEKIIFKKPVETVVFDHSIHVGKANLACESCHKEVFSMTQGDVQDQKLVVSDDPNEKREYLINLHKKYCGTCHDSAQAFGYLTRCTVCHIGVKGLEAMTNENTKKDGNETTKH
jgi:c(7)-type cytochrome triheme protein